jgi:DNA polymerase III psi subunit
MKRLTISEEVLIAENEKLSDRLVEMQIKLSDSCHMLTRLIQSMEYIPESRRWVLSEDVAAFHNVHHLLSKELKP